LNAAFTNFPVTIPFMDVICNKCLLTLLVCGRDIENFVTLLIAHLEHMFHLENIYLEGWPHNKHGNHATEGNVRPSLSLGMNHMPL